jgi:hypothetical protein
MAALHHVIRLLAANVDVPGELELRNQLHPTDATKAAHHVSVMRTQRRQNAAIRAHTQGAVVRLKLRVQRAQAPQ